MYIAETQIAEAYVNWIVCCWNVNIVQKELQNFFQQIRYVFYTLSTIYIGYDLVKRLIKNILDGMQ